MTLDDLERIVARRASETDGSSYTATLVSAGPARIAKKLGEEGVEAALACAAGDRAEMTTEAADVLYHLLVALHATGGTLADVMGELERRTGRSGLEEKASRPTGRGSGPGEGADIPVPNRP